jgi:hypothetical protein
MPPIYPILKRWSEVVGVVVILGGVLAGIVRVSGGHLPFWVSYAEGMELKARQDQQAVTQALFAHDYYCDKLRRARKDAAEHPSEAASEDVRILIRRVQSLERVLSPGVAPPSDPCY